MSDIELEMPDAIRYFDEEQSARLTHLVTVERVSQAAELFGLSNVVVNSTHHQAVVDVATGLRATARTSDGIVEVMELSNPGGAFGMSVQFHPERRQEQNQGYRRLFERFVTAARG